MSKTAAITDESAKSKISSLQFMFLIITLVIATADVFLPAFVAQEAERDSWISAIIGTISSLVIVNIFIALALRHPDKTFIEYSCDILGKPLGKLCGFIFLYYVFMVTVMVTKQLGEIFVTSFNPEAPILIYIISVILVASYAVGKGIEVISRVNEILLPIGLAILLFVSFINIGNLDFKNFLPIMYNGILPPLRGALLIQTWLIESVIVLQLVPLVKDSKRIRRNTTISIIMLGIGLEMGVLTVALFGPITKNFIFPALQFVRFASLGEYFRGLDISIMGVWIAGIFIKLAVFYYVFVTGLVQLLGLKAYKQLIVPAGIIIISFSMVVSRSIMEFTHFLHFIFPLYSLVIAFILPAFLLIISVFRNKKPADKSI